MNRRAFTLFELMIVVVLIGVVYALVLSNFNTKKKVRFHKIENIKEALLPYWSRGKRLDFYLYDSCEKSALFINDRYHEEITPDIPTSEFQKLEVYNNDSAGGETKINFTPIVINQKLHKVCFHYTLFPNGSNSSYVVQKGKQFYIFYPYLQDVNQTESLSEAMDLLKQKSYRGVSIDDFHD